MAIRTTSSARTARALLADLDHAAPFDATFLSLEPGCAAIGQGTELASAVEKAMERRFHLWENSWLRPRLEEIAKTDGRKR